MDRFQEEIVQIDCLLEHCLEISVLMGCSVVAGQISILRFKIAGECVELPDLKRRNNRRNNRRRENRRERQLGNECH